MTKKVIIFLKNCRIYYIVISYIYFASYIPTARFF